MNDSPVQQWLAQQAPGFDQLPEPERKAIYDFCMLWGLFENRCCGRNANIPKLKAVCDQIDFTDPESVAALQEPLAYFTDRYVDENGFTYRFDHLRLGNGEWKTHVEAVLTGQLEAHADVLLGLLIIVYRFRNNLFHGEKWAYQLREQQPNFETANALLMWLMDQAPGQS